MNDNEAFRSPLQTCAKGTDLYKSASMKRDFGQENEDSENIPYHARETAQPFTYGSLPEGFLRSQLNHVGDIYDEPEVENFKQPFSKVDNNLNNLEATAIIEVIPLEKDKKENSNKRKFQQSDNNVINKTKQKDKHLLLTKNELRNDQCENYTRNLSENINNKIILGGNEISDERQGINILDNDLNLLNIGNSKVQRVLATNELKRCETPSFPFEETIIFPNRSSSPYPTLNPQNCSPNVTNKNERKAIKKNNTEAQSIDTNFVKFAEDTSKLWYKPRITREKSLKILCNATPGSFIIRNSTTYKNSFGLVLRVSRPVNSVSANGNGELVRHYLLEPTDCGVRLKGYHNEPVFTSLSAFVYQHSVDELALPCKLIIPKTDLLLSSGQVDLIIAQEQLLAQGAACNVLYLFSYNTESLTGDEAIRKASNEMFVQFNNIKPIEVHFKVSKYGVTLTDNKRLLFFRRYYSAQNISYFGIEPDKRLWMISNKVDDHEEVPKTIFAFVARPLAGGNDNQCHIFCDLSVKQPASAIISFTQKVLPLAVIGNK